MDEWAVEFEYGLSIQAVSFKMGTRCQRMGFIGSRLEAGGQSLEAWRPEAGGQRLKTVSQRPEVRIQRPKGGG